MHDGDTSPRSRRRWLVLGAAATAPVALATVVLAFGMASAAPPPPPVSVPVSGVDPVLADAYARASARAPELGPGCVVRPSVVTAIGRVESAHAAGHTVGPTGDVTPPIVGPAVGPDTDDGRLDADPTADHAVGLTQLLPSSWAAYGTDGSGDGLADPHNAYDAAVSAVAQLCATVGGDYGDPAVLSRALRAYNHSDAYVAEVLAWVATYDGSTADPQSLPGGLVTVEGITVAAALGPNLEALLAHARADGVVLGGGGYRSSAQQVALRRAHCGTSDYAVYQAPASSCSPPTAPPGSSRHELGLAVDFTQGGRTLTRSSPGYAWLARNAGAYGLHNLPAEAWHWSTDGR